MVRVQDVQKGFGAVRAVAGATLAVERGEIVAVLGPSGCGKTTLLRLIAGFERPDTGSIAVGGATVAGTAWSPPERRNVGMVFQDYALFPHLTVAQNVGFGLPRGRRAARVAEALDLVGLAGYDARYPHGLSGGQQQRVALARALAPEPAVILLDEPWSNIDPLLRASMRREVLAILRAAGTTAIVVTHDQEEAFGIADRIVLMRDGRVVQAGRPEELYVAPVDRWAAEFLGAANFLPGDVLDDLGAASPDWRDREAADVLVRPELLELLPDPEGRARVVAREFRGHDVFYSVLLDDGRELLSQRPSNECVGLGERVSVVVHERRPVALA